MQNPWMEALTISDPTSRVVAVVVTFNRWELLLETLNGLLHLARPLQHIVVVDNASSDGTPDRLLEHGWIGDPPPADVGVEWRWTGEIKGAAGERRVSITYLHRGTNDGGAGGFAAGLREAVTEGCDWLWLMDDDVEPAGDSLDWAMADLAGEPRRVVQQRRVYEDGSDVELQAARLNLSNPFRELKLETASFARDDSPVPVSTFTFEGLLLPRRLVEEIGLPDASFFVFADDTDYAIRAQRAGFGIVASARSRIVKKIRMTSTPEYTQRHYYYFRNLYRLDLRYGNLAVRTLRPTLLVARRLLGCLKRRASRESYSIVWRSYRDAGRLERGR